MTIYSVYVINKAGGLIYQYDHHKPLYENEKTFSFPLEISLEKRNDQIEVVFGQQDGVQVGHVVLAINGKQARGRKLEDGTDIIEAIQDKSNYPISIKFGKPQLTSNLKIMYASMFHSLYAISVQLSPEKISSGIQKLEVDAFTLQCNQTHTGVKFFVISDPKQNGIDMLLKKLYLVYADFALKNPFHSLEMPIRFELFDQNVVGAVEQVEKYGHIVS